LALTLQQYGQALSTFSTDVTLADLTAVSNALLSLVNDYNFNYKQARRLAGDYITDSTTCLRNVYDLLLASPYDNFVSAANARQYYTLLLPMVCDCIANLGLASKYINITLQQQFGSLHYSFYANTTMQNTCTQLFTNVQTILDQQTVVFSEIPLKIIQWLQNISAIFDLSNSELDGIWKVVSDLNQSKVLGGILQGLNVLIEKTPAISTCLLQFEQTLNEVIKDLSNSMQDLAQSHAADATVTSCIDRYTSVTSSMTSANQNIRALVEFYLTGELGGEQLSSDLGALLDNMAYDLQLSQMGRAVVLNAWHSNLMVWYSKTQSIYTSTIYDMQRFQSFVQNSTSFQTVINYLNIWTMPKIVINPNSTSAAVALLPMVTSGVNKSGVSMATDVQNSLADVNTTLNRILSDFNTNIQLNIDQIRNTYGIWLEMKSNAALTAQNFHDTFTVSNSFIR
jgi:flagellar hook-basal body complex protein FliE